MSEVEKMYRNAGVEKMCTNSDDCLMSDNFPKNCDNRCVYIEYPTFTAEKQLEICKLLLKVEHSISYYFYENRYGFVIDDKQDDCIEAEKFEIALAMIVNYLWQDLTEAERKQIKEILE